MLEADLAELEEHPNENEPVRAQVETEVDELYDVSDGEQPGELSARLSLPEGLDEASDGEQTGELSAGQPPPASPSVQSEFSAGESNFNPEEPSEW